MPGSAAETDEALPCTAAGNILLLGGCVPVLLRRLISLCLGTPCSGIPVPRASRQSDLQTVRVGAAAETLTRFLTE